MSTFKQITVVDEEGKFLHERFGEELTATVEECNGKMRIIIKEEKMSLMDDLYEACKHRCDSKRDFKVAISEHKTFLKNLTEGRVLTETKDILLTTIDRLALEQTDFLQSNSLYPYTYNLLSEHDKKEYDDYSSEIARIQRVIDALSLKDDV